MVEEMNKKTGWGGNSSVEWTVSCTDSDQTGASLLEVSGLPVVRICARRILNLCKMTLQHGRHGDKQVEVGPLGRSPRFRILNLFQTTLTLDTSDKQGFFFSKIVYKDPVLKKNPK
jgi:hypothetical protein